MVSSSEGRDPYSLKTCGVSHGSKAPENHRHRVTDARTQPVDQTPHKNHAQRVRRLKRKHQVPVVDVVPAKFMLQRALQHPKHLAVHVIFGYAEK